jgi:sec-independent protein translocase protein TatC
MKRLPRRLQYGEEATLVEHLEELRQRMFVCLGVLAIAFIVAFAFHRHILALMNKPLPHAVGKPVTFGVTEPFLTSTWVSLYAAFLVSLPVILWQAWSFFMPAVDKVHERTMAIFVGAAAVLLVVGMVFGYYLALPAAVHFLTHYDDTQYHVLIQARSYYSFTAMVLFAMGIVFELPLFVLGMVQLGILSTAKLRRSRRVGYFIVACVGVALPGIDPITTLIETIPLWILYELSIWLSVLVERRHPAPAEAPVEAPGMPGS